MGNKKQQNAPKKDDSQHLKDSCDYAIGISKTLISYSAAGIAFMISIILSGRNFYPNWATWIIVISLAISVFLGLFFLMNVVGHINQFKNYNVNLPRLRKITLWQMTLFFIPILILGGFAIWQGTSKNNKAEKSFIKINSGKIDLERELSKQDTLKLLLNGDKWEIHK